jgi:hypothetical protein
LGGRWPGALETWPGNEKHEVKIESEWKLARSLLCSGIEIERGTNLNVDSYARRKTKKSRASVGFDGERIYTRA